MDKLAVWEKTKARGFEMQHSSDFIYLIENNLDRVEFVKDHVGLRDIVFATERDVGTYHPFYIAIDVDASKDKSYDVNDMEFSKKVETRELIALNQLDKFFKETSRKMCVAIGFKETENYDRKKIVEASYANPDKSSQEIMKDTREFPFWYEELAKDAKDITYLPVKVEAYLASELGENHKKSLLSKIEEIKTYVANDRKDEIKLAELTFEIENISYEKTLKE